MDENLNLNKNTDIEKALKEFELKSEIEQTQKPPEILKHEVEGVKFETPSYGAGKFCHGADTPKMVQLVMKWSGGCLSQRQAECVLLGFVVVMIGISLFLVFGGGKTVSRPAEIKVIPAM